MVITQINPSPYPLPLTNSNSPHTTVRLITIPPTHVKQVRLISAVPPFHLHLKLIRLATQDDVRRSRGSPSKNACQAPNHTPNSGVTMTTKVPSPGVQHVQHAIYSTLPGRTRTRSLIKLNKQLGVNYYCSVWLPKDAELHPQYSTPKLPSSSSYEEIITSDSRPSHPVASIS